MQRELIVEAGVPVADPVHGDNVVRPGVLPAGRFATVTYVGSPEHLVAVNRHLLEWPATKASCSTNRPAMPVCLGLPT
jgi:hypothetical protein